MTQPAWAARSEPERETIPPASPPPNGLDITFHLRGGAILLLVMMLAGLALRLVIAYVLYPNQGLGNDLRLYAGWAQTLADHGPGGFYANAGFADYTPGYLYVLWALGVLGDALAGPLGMSSADAIQALLKLPAIAADMAVAWLLYRSLSRWHGQRAGLIAASLYLFIPVTWYESALWGQMDSVGALLLLAAVLLLIDGWSEPATAMAMLAAVTKPQYAIGLLVVIGVAVGRHVLRPEAAIVPLPGRRVAALDRRLGGWFTRQQGFRRLFACAITAAAVFVITVMPFDLQRLASPSMAGIPILDHISGYGALVANSAAYYNVLTANAFNFWSLVGPTPLSHALSSNYVWTYDSLPILGVAASTIGTILFVLIAVAVTGALVWRSDRMSILLGLTVLAVAFFAVPTRVHERYLFPTFAIGAILAATSIRWRWWYLVLGLANAANLHAILTLPYPGYGTPAMRNLPLGGTLRSEAAITVVAVIVSVAFLAALAVFARTSMQPAFAGTWSRLRIWNAGASGAQSAAVPPLLAQGRLSRPPESARRRVRSIGRAELGIALLLVLLTFGSRVFQLGTPKGMYFDEVWHAGTATEFLQDWRYDIPHVITEWTHPPLAKYAMATSIALVGDNKVTSTEALGSPVSDVAFEPTYWEPAASGGTAGDRIIIATGSGILVAEHGQLASAAKVALPGAQALAVDTAAHRTFVGTRDGTIWEFSSAAFDTAAASGKVPQPIRLGTVGSAVTKLRPVGYDGLIVQSGGRLILLDLTTPEGTATVTASISLPAITDVETFNVNGVWLVLAATPDGLVQFDPNTLAPKGQLSLLGGARGLDLVYGSTQQKAWRDLLGTPTLYVATGAARLELIAVGANGRLTDQGGFSMPGTVTDVRWNRATNLVHVLGKTRGGQPTIYVVEPNNNAVFADAELPFQPSSWALDAQPNDPGSDRERVLAFSAPGTYVTVDAGSNAFAWRLPGVIAGALLAGLLYLLAMVLFRRRSVGLIFAGLISMDGLLFGQSRIAMNDVFLELFVVAAFLVLAYLLQSRSLGRRAVLQGLLLPPLMGLLFGLAFASKWPALYAMGAAVLIILLRSGLGRWLALAGMVGLTAVFGFQSLADNPPNITFTLLMVGLTVLLGVGIVRAEPASTDAALWVDPRWRRGLPFAWVLACILIIPFAVYVASYIPWALSGAGAVNLFASWPPGHIETFTNLQQAMYNYHNEFRYPHGASSPWWAWPFDLKPIWSYLDNLLGNVQATILDAGNPFLFWLGIPAAGFGMWQAWRRRDASLGLVAIVLLALWLPWARIDRVTFNYHFYAALPFLFLLLAYFLAELWDGPSARTWLLARASVAVVLIAPALLWIGVGPLCAAAGVAQGNPSSVICTAGFGEWPAWTLPWLAAWIVICAVAWRFIRPRLLVAFVLVGAAVAFLAMYPALSAWPLPSGLPGTYQSLLPSWDSGFQFASNQQAVAKVSILGLGTAATLIVTVALVVAAMVRAGWHAPWNRIHIDDRTRDYR